MPEPFYQFKRAMLPDEDELNALGRKGWHIAAVQGDAILMQRLIVEEEAAPPPAPEAKPPTGERVESLCGCGCGEMVAISQTEYDDARKLGMVWFLPGHGETGAAHDEPYAAVRVSGVVKSMGIPATRPRG